MNDSLKIKDYTFTSRLFTGTGKFHDNTLITPTLLASGSQLVTVALRRLDPEAQHDDIASRIPEGILLMPNTSGARNAEEAIRIARICRAAGYGDFIKIEIITDQKYLMPDGEETLKATRILAAEGFIVMPYVNADIPLAIKLEEAGAATIMPLGSAIGTNRGIRTKELIRYIIDTVGIPVVVDAGIGKPSQAAEAMELGADAVLVNTAIACSSDPVAMGKAFALAVEAGRTAYIAGMASTYREAQASSPLTGFLHES